MPDHSCSKDIFPNIQSQPPLTQLEAIASRPIASYLGEETNTRLTTTSCQVAIESDKVSPQPPFLQTEQPQLPQSLLIRPVLQTLHQLLCSSLDMLQHLSVLLVVRGCTFYQRVFVLLGVNYHVHGCVPTRTATSCGTPQSILSYSKNFKICKTSGTLWELFRWWYTMCTKSNSTIAKH